MKGYSSLVRSFAPGKLSRGSTHLASAHSAASSSRMYIASVRSPARKAVVIRLRYSSPLGPVSGPSTLIPGLAFSKVSRFSRTIWGL